MKQSTPLSDWFHKWLDNPGGQVTRWQRAARYSIDLTWHCAKALRHDEAAEMAAALTYRTIFSLIPILVISLVVFSAFEGFDELRAKVQTDTIEYLGLNTLSTTEQPVKGSPVAEGGAETSRGTGETGVEPEPGASGAGGEGAAKVQDKLVAVVQQQTLVAQKISELIGKIEGLNFASIGVIGFLVLVWAALSLVISLEYSFNQIYNVSAGRTYLQRITLYWTTLTLGPVLVLSGVYVLTKAAGIVEGWGEESGFLGTLLQFVGRFASVGATWLLLFFLYNRMPYTRVELRPAAIGAFVAALLWETAKYGFGLYVKNAAFTKEIYGTLALIPLFLFWVYLTWLITLFGLELTYTLQNMRGRKFKHDEHKHEDHVIDPSWVIPLAAKIGSAFHEGKAARAEELGLEMNLPPRVILQLVGALEKAGLVRRVLHGQGTEGVTLAKPAQSIALAEVVRAGRTLLSDSPASLQGDPAWKAVTKIYESQYAQFKGQTLADFCSAQSGGG